jgi:hypothetical protein
MNPSHLNVVTPSFQESASNRAKRLMAEARAAALEHVAALETAMEAVAAIAADVGEGGDAYPIGVRELARQLNDETVSRLQTLNAILSKSSAA